MERLRLMSRKTTNVSNEGIWVYLSILHMPILVEEGDDCFWNPPLDSSFTRLPISLFLFGHAFLCLKCLFVPSSCSYACVFSGVAFV
jgi:hypothetical protein